ncbi:MAG: hypothetical protein FJ110_11770 [Deltaproteobacteria bacterium]|nr:hypothetical protein [Deltaproteobacteria bacterium]
MAQIELHPDFKDFLRLLNSHGVKYLVVGGIIKVEKFVQEDKLFEKPLKCTRKIVVREEKRNTVFPLPDRTLLYP